jgi:hypothetical protein
MIVNATADTLHLDTKWPPQTTVHREALYPRGVVQVVQVILTKELPYVHAIGRVEIVCVRILGSDRPNIFRTGGSRCRNDGYARQ